jgi:hypothetical protein
MRGMRICVILACLLPSAGPAGAVIGTIDNVPAATLLLPYFEADLVHAKGIDTVFTINNASDEAILTHITVWSDQSVPVLNFNVYLTGYDAQTISMREVLNGTLPITASAAQDPGDTISPQGPISDDDAFVSCSYLPYTNPYLDPVQVADLQAWLTGNMSPSHGNCAGAQIRDGIARGYVTVDTVNACNINVASDWAFYAPWITDQNVLWGDWIFVDGRRGLAQGDMLVHIEACPTCFAPGEHTFYGRYDGATADDAREPLPTTWATRFYAMAPKDGGAETSLIVWREGSSSSSGHSCALQGPSSWYPLPVEQVLLFDESESAMEVTPSIPNETQRISVRDDLSAPFSVGWAYLNLQHSQSAYPDPYAQSWIIAVTVAEGRFSVGYNPLQLDNANSPVTTKLPTP